MLSVFINYKLYAIVKYANVSSQNSGILVIFRVKLTVVFTEQIEDWGVERLVLGIVTKARSLSYVQGSPDRDLL